MMRYFIVSLCGLLLLFTSALTKESRQRQARARQENVMQATGFPGGLPAYRPGTR